MKSEYCTQNEGNCEICSLVNYGRDCQNNSIKERNDSAKLKQSLEQFTGTS